MNPRWHWTCAVWFYLASTSFVRAGLPEDVQQLRGASTNAEKQAAYGRLVAAGGSALVPLLEAWPTEDAVAGHWFRATWDDALKNCPVSARPTEALARWARDPKRSGASRRAARAALTGTEAGQQLDALLAVAYSDPEFGSEAIEARLAQIELNRTQRTEAERKLLEELLAAATDPAQLTKLNQQLVLAGQPQRLHAALGLLPCWQIAGPWPLSPEEGLTQNPIIPIPGRSDRPTLPAGFTWKDAIIPADQDRLDLLKLGVQPSQGSVVYLWTQWEQTQPQEWELRAAAVDNLTLWLDGQKLLERADLYRSMYRADRYRAVVTLAAGPHSILVKLTKTPPDREARGGGPGPRWDFSARWVDRQGRAPISQILSPKEANR